MLAILNNESCILTQISSAIKLRSNLHLSETLFVTPSIVESPFYATVGPLSLSSRLLKVIILAELQNLIHSIFRELTFRASPIFTLGFRLFLLFAHHLSH